MINLIKIELIKQFKKRSFKVLFIIILIVSFLNNYLNYKNYEYKSNENYNYLELSNKNEKSINEYNHLIKDNIDKHNYYKKNNIEMHIKEKYILETSITVIVFMSIIIAIVSSGILSDEINKKSIKELIAKPYKRYKILTSKFISVFIITFLIVFNIVLVSLISSSFLLKINWINVKEIIIYKSKIIESLYLLNYFKLVLINSIPLIFIGISCIFMSTLISNSKIISGISIFFSLMGTLIFQLFLKFNINIVEYTFLPYLDLSIYKNMLDIYKINIAYNVNLNLVSGIVILTIYSIIFYIISILIFNKKDIVN